MNLSSYTRRDFFKVAGVCITSLAVSKSSLSKVKADQPPNIILIMVDDMGFSDLGCYGSEIETPNLDHLAAGGLRFTQFYNNALCVPTRASLLTGLYPNQFDGLTENIRIEGRIKNCVTLADVLKTAGYTTLMTGKWHNNSTPTKMGFDRYYGLLSGCCNYFNPGLRRPGEKEPGRKYPGEQRPWGIDGKIVQPYTPEDQDFYATDAFTNCAISYLDQYGKQPKPFFLYLAYTAPHFPLHARPEDIEKYKDKYMVGWDIIRKQRYERMLSMSLFDKKWSISDRYEEVPKWNAIVDKKGWALKMAVYAAMIDRIDQGIGRIMTKLSKLGLEDNTLVLFLSDNGGCSTEVNRTPDILPGPMESYRSIDAPWANASNTPFRKFKTWNHEGGISTPLIAYWPKVIKQGGKITNQVGHLIDIMATFVDISRAKYPQFYKDSKIIPLQGKSLMSIFQGRERSGHDALFWWLDYSLDKRTYLGFPAQAVRKDKWKLVSGRKGNWELYDMEADRTELNNLADKFPKKTKELKKLYESWVGGCIQL